MPRWWFRMVVYFIVYAVAAEVFVRWEIATHWVPAHFMLAISITVLMLVGFVLNAWFAMSKLNEMERDAMARAGH